jgi:two-component system cell cycle sensor histidine kinase/response regulator CckA
MRPGILTAAKLAPYPMPSMDPSQSSSAMDRLLLAALPDAILLVDTLGLIRDANPAAERLFARPLDVLQSAQLDRLVMLPDGGGFGNLMRSGLVATPERRTGCRGRSVDGVEFLCDVTVAPIPTMPGRWALQVTETSLRDFHAIQRQESAKMSAVATLAAGIANDFNNALAAISGSIEAARLRIVSQDRVPPRELLEAKEATRGAARLVRRLLNFARPSTGLRRPLDPALILDDVGEVLRRDLDPRITLVMRADHAGWRVLGDPEQLTDLLVSLGHNAIDAMPTGGTLTISTSCTEAGLAGAPASVAGREFVCISVRDTGVGIPAEDLPRIFEPFFTTKEAGRGAGLGLGNAYVVLQQHEGGITVESAPGAGSLFQVYLPRTLERPSQISRALALEPATGRGTILLVDDESAVRRPIRQALELVGYTVHEAKDGIEALEIHADTGKRVDLVVLDVKMPGMSGWQVLEELKHRAPGLPVILTSGYTQEDSAPGGGAIAPDAYLPKPYDLAELTATVRQLMPAAEGAEGEPQ